MHASLNAVNMNAVVKTHNILLICLDSLRLDVARYAEQNNLTPTINQFGAWEHRHAAGNFTFPSHIALFSGFFPSPVIGIAKETRKKSWRASWSPFIAKHGERGTLADSHAFAFEGDNLVQGLANIGFLTLCIGGVAFFDKRSALGKIMPAFFKESYWSPRFSTRIKEGIKHQVDFLLQKQASLPQETKLFTYLNIATTHYPTTMYLDDAPREESFASQLAALCYADAELARLFAAAKAQRPTFVMLFSDHGTCFGEDGFYYHGHSHAVVMNVPYKQFFL
jgi:membrane-anchored protein YejM (alkaline phosphatase superfamily)